MALKCQISRALQAKKDRSQFLHCALRRIGRIGIVGIFIANSVGMQCFTRKWSPLVHLIFGQGDYLAFNEEEHPVVVQLGGSDPEAMVKSALHVPTTRL